MTAPLPASVDAADLECMRQRWQIRILRRNAILRRQRIEALLRQIERDTAAPGVVRLPRALSPDGAKGE